MWPCGWLCLCTGPGRVRFCFFFFQAEDGIRDVAVTGVQTCALPITLVGAALSGVLDLFDGLPRGLDTAVFSACVSIGIVWTVFRLVPVAVRSEERRVGKSVDLGGRRIIKKKKKRRE